MYGRTLSSQTLTPRYGFLLTALIGTDSVVCHGFCHGTSACLSALFRAERYEEIIDLRQVDAIWPYKRWAVMARAAMDLLTRA